MNPNRELSEQNQNVSPVSVQTAAAVAVQCIYEQMTLRFPNETNSLNSFSFVGLVSATWKMKVTATSARNVYWNDQSNFTPAVINFA